MTASPQPPSERDARIATALALIEQGKSLADVASEFHVTPQAISQFLLGNVPEKYRELQERGLIARIVDADTKLENASSHLEVARAREIAKFRRWDAERRLKHLFGPSQEVTGADRGPIQLDNLERARRIAFINASVIEAEIVSTQCSTGST